MYLEIIYEYLHTHVYIYMQGGIPLPMPLSLHQNLRSFKEFSRFQVIDTE
jgi:hypothetical protein